MGNVISFTVKGEKYPLVETKDFTLDELEAIETFYGEDFETIATRRLRMMRVMLWISVKRLKPDFTLEDAGSLGMGALGDALARKNEPEDHQAAGRVLSPTSAGRKRAPRPATKSADA
jgi:hypothetical protein